jgi:hypothetical protein
LSTPGVAGDILPPPVRAGRALRPGAGQYQPADQRGPGEGHVLGHEATEGEAEQVRPRQADRIGEGDDLLCGLGDSVRGQAGGRADAGVVDEDDLALGRQGIDKCRVPVVDVAAEVLQHQQRHVAGPAESPVGVGDAVSRPCELRRCCQCGDLCSSHFPVPLGVTGQYDRSS